MTIRLLGEKKTLEARRRKIPAGGHAPESFAGIRRQSIQARLFEDGVAKLEGTAEHIRFWGQRTYMELVNLHFALHKIPLLPGERIRIDFLCIAAYLWPVWQSVYEACRADERMKVRIILLDRAHSFLEDASLCETQAFFQQEGIPYISYADYVPDADRPHIMVYQFPYTKGYEYFRKVSPDLVKLRGTRPVYISYGIEYDEARHKDAINFLHYHQYVQSLAWRVFVMHEDIREGFFRNCRTGGEHVHALGHPRFDVYARKAPPLPEHIEAVRKGRRMVFCQVHHPSDHDSRYAYRTHSLPVEETIAILLWLAEQADMCAVITLHPLFEPWAIQKRHATAEALEGMKEAIRQSPNAVLHTGEYQSLLPYMDAFISDQSSLLLEMAYQNKPVLYLYDEPLALKPFAEEIFASFYHGRGYGRGLADAQAFLQRVRCGDDPLAGERQRVWNTYFSACDGRIAQRITEHMITALYVEGSDNP